MERPYLPNEMFHEILSFVEFKRLIQFKIICKTWCMIIEHILRDYAFRFIPLNILITREMKQSIGANTIACHCYRTVNKKDNKYYYTLLRPEQGPFNNIICIVKSNN